MARDGAGSGKYVELLPGGHLPGQLKAGSLKLAGVVVAGFVDLDDRAIRPPYRSRFPWAALDRVAQALP